MYGKDYVRYSELSEAKKALETRLNIGGEVSSVFDPVDKPIHYNSGGIEAIAGIEASMSPEGFAGYLKGNVMKYMWRYENKGKPIEDLKKARWYLERLISLRERKAD